MLEQLRNLKLNNNEIAIIWLGQAGFLIKNFNDKIIAIDPYLSHCGERLKNFIRLSPIVVNPKDLVVDYYITTHKHFDHFDYDTIALLSNKDDIKFMGPNSCEKEFLDLGIISNNIVNLQHPSEFIEDDIKIISIYADHGELEPDAIGVQMLLGSIKLYFTGDTSYRPDKLDQIKDSNPDIMFASINGEFGNLNHIEGALLAHLTKSKNIVPCHFWTFIQHKGNPELLEDEVKKHSPETNTIYLTPGEIYIYEKGEENESSKIYRA